jgi:metallo-beta-lactamase class B
VGLADGARADEPCALCESWNAPHEPFRLYGNTYYIGTAGLSSILIVSDSGDVLIDGDLTESAPQIAANIRALGFRPEDVKLILNSHAHFDHAGGLAELQHLTGAKVWASPSSARGLQAGNLGQEDPQYGTIRGFPPVESVSVVSDGQTLKLGTIAITAHFTPGHTPGGTSWTWDSCDGEKCFHVVYADSLSAIAAPRFRFNRPPMIAEFQKSFGVLRSLPCDILLSPHPEASNLWARLERREKGDADALVDTTACGRYADQAQAAFEKRLVSEKN